MMIVYKLLRPAEWAAFEADEVFAGSADDLRDGYIHLSTAEQVEGTRAKYFVEESAPILLAVDAETLCGELRWEPSRGGVLFPHLYRPLRLGEVRRVAGPPLPA